MWVGIGRSRSSGTRTVARPRSLRDISGKISVTLVQPRCSVKLLHGCFNKRCYLRDIGAARGAAACNLEVDSYAVQRVPNIVTQLSELGRLVTLIHKNSVAQIRVVRCRFDHCKIGVRHGTMLRGSVHVLRYQVTRVVDVQLP